MVTQELMQAMVQDRQREAAVAFRQSEAGQSQGRSGRWAFSWPRIRLPLPSLHEPARDIAALKEV